MSVEQSYERIASAIEREFRLENLKRHAAHIAAMERTFCYRRFAESSGYCHEQFRAAGLSDVQRVTLPADGVTTHMDYTMPQAWDAEDASLEIVALGASPIPLIDYRAMPFSLANRCGPTPPEGITASVITQQQLAQRDSAKDCFVYTDGQSPKGLRAEAIAKGAAGLISDALAARDVAPDETNWINGWGSPGWYLTREDAPLTCFSISPTKGAMLKGFLAKGEVRVRARALTRLYDGSIYTVSGLVPGKSEREIVLLAHIYEPFPCDDASGAAALIEIGRTLTALRSQGALPPLELGIRLVISMEVYGFAQYFVPEEVRRRSVLGVSLDTICLSPAKSGVPVEVRLSPASMPFWGDLLLWPMANRKFAGRPLEAKPGTLSDDTFISDRTIGVPSQWVWTRSGIHHHSSAWLREEMNDWPLGGDIAALTASYAAAMATANQQDIAQFGELTVSGFAEELQAQTPLWAEAMQRGSLTGGEVHRQIGFFGERQEGRLRSLARMFPTVDIAPLRVRQAAFQAQTIAALSAGQGATDRLALSEAQAAAQRMVPVRRTLGTPFSQARIPRAERVAGQYARALNWADGKLNVLEIAERAQWDTGVTADDQWLRQFMAYCRLLDKYGYIGLSNGH